MQKLAGNRATASALTNASSRARPLVVQREAPSPAPAAPTFPDVNAGVTQILSIAANPDAEVRKTLQPTVRTVIGMLNGLSPEDLISTLAGVDRKDVLLRYIRTDGFDIPRLSTGLAGVMSGKSADALESVTLIDTLRATKGSAAFWSDSVAAIAPAHFRELLLFADRDILTALQDYLENATPEIHAKYGPVLGKLFDPPASDVELEFVPDEMDAIGTVLKKNGDRVVGLLPSGLLTAKVAGRVVTAIDARGGAWEHQNVGGGHFADPTKAGKHKLEAAHAVITGSWGPGSLLPDGTPLKTEVDEKRVKQAFYQDGSGWHNTVTLSDPVDHKGIADEVNRYRKLYADQPEWLAALPPEGEIPDKWFFNDFGDHAYHIQGTDEFVHTTPKDEVAHLVDIAEELSFSHGCLHIQPGDRDRLESLRLLKAGVTLNVHAYVKGVREYGKSPDFT